MASIASTLGVGSGIDTKTLVAQLVAAQNDPKTAAITTQNTRVTAQISGLAQLKSGLTNFSSSLSTLIAGGSLSTQPTSSDASIVTASLTAGARLSATSSTIEVQQLATQQIVVAGGVASADAPVGKGTLSFTFGTGAGTGGSGKLDSFTPGAGTPINVTIDDSNNSLTGLAKAINAKNAGVTATIVNDGTVSRLVIKGASGAAQSFTMQATEDASAPGLANFDFGTTAGASTLQQAAKDSITVVDGVPVKRASNTLTDVIDGVTLGLTKAAVGTTVIIGASRPSSALSSAVSDFVAAYNELQTILTEQADPKTGVLSGDASVRQMRRQLSGLTSTPLRAGGSPSTLAELGVSTNRDGTLSVDTTALNKMVAANPDGVEAMFNPAQSSSSALVKITSASGAAKAGSYLATNLVAAKSGSLKSEARPNLFATPPLSVPAGGYTIKVGMDGKTPLAVTIPEGDYANGAALAAALAIAIKGSGTTSVVSVAWGNNQFVATSALIGASSAVTMTMDDAAAAATLGLDNTTVVQGVDASGMIDGKPAVSSGTRLFAAQGTSAYGIVIQPSSDVASATLSVDLGLGAALAAINSSLTSTDGGLYTSSARLTKLQSDLATQQAKVTSDATAMSTRLTKQFASMDTRVAAYKATQSFLTQQIDAWNKSDN